MDGKSPSDHVLSRFIDEVWEPLGAIDDLLWLMKGTRDHGVPSEGGSLPAGLHAYCLRVRRGTSEIEDVTSEVHTRPVPNEREPDFRYYWILADVPLLTKEELMEGIGLSIDCAR